MGGRDWEMLGEMGNLREAGADVWIIGQGGLALLRPQLRLAASGLGRRVVEAGLKLEW